MPTRPVDAVVVGAGPAGSAAAIGLRRLGFSVALLEKSRFPRDKICGDFLTPGAVGLLGSLGGGLHETASPWVLRGMRITFEGAEIVSDFPAGSPGWSLSRRRLDAALARRAAAAGAEVLHELRVTSVTREPDGTGLTVTGSHPDGSILRWRAPLVVDAGGRHGVIGRRLGWHVRDRRLTRFALWSHMDGVRELGERGEMHVMDGGYVGVGPLERGGGPGAAGAANVTMVLTPGRMARARGDVRGYFLDTLARHPEMGRRCRDARLMGPVRGLGPLACSASRLAGGGVSLVGDTAGFVDPFTGEGVYSALAGAGLLAAAIERLGPGEAALAAYQRDHRAHFAGKQLLSRCLQMVIARPRLARHVARALATRRDLADRMVGATGDLLPPSRVLNPAYIGRLLVAGLTGS